MNLRRTSTAHWFFLAAVTFPQLGLSQGLATASRVTNDVLDPAEQCVVDIDGDGDLDAVAISAVDGQISYWENRGAPNFGPQNILPFTEANASLCSGGDIDGDGLGDLVIATEAGEFLLFRQQSVGDWVRQPLGALGESSDLALHDLNGDGALDLVSILADGIGWSPWTGGAFAARTLLGPVDLELIDPADIDSDGDLDLLTERFGSVITWLENDGSGSFVTRQEDAAPGTSNPGSGFIDLDEDGLLDEITVGTFPSSAGLAFARFRLRTVGGGWGSWSGVYGFGSSLLCSEVAPVQAPSLEQPGAVVVPLAGIETFSGSPELKVCGVLTFDPLVGGWTQQSTVISFGEPLVGGWGDLDGDGVTDNFRGGKRATLIDGASSTETDLADWAGQKDGVEAVDFNGDGRTDLLAAGPLLGEFALFLGLGGGSYARRRLIGSTTGLPSEEGRGPTLIDADLDGDLDIAFPITSTQFGWMERDASGLGALQVVGLPGGESELGTTQLTSVDLDGDGDQDLLYLFRRELSWFQSFGSAFGPQQVLASQVASVATADLDENGIVDLVIGGQPMQWLQGVGGGGFLPATPLSIDGGAEELFYADISGDGRRDLLVRDTDVAWYQNFGGLIFGPRQVVLPGATARIEPGDLDSDGDIDVVSASPAPGVDAFWLENLGGVLSSPINVLGDGFSSTTETSLALRDADLDGDLDVLLATTNSVGWIENLFNNAPGIGVPYCSPAIANSTGLPGRIRATGSVVVADGDVTITAYSLPVAAFGYFVTSEQPGFSFPVGNSEGALCVGGLIGRYVGPGQIQNSGALGEFSLQLDLNAMPSAIGFMSADPGETWHFQAWHRDAIGGQTTSNFTDAVAVTFQ